MSAREIDLGPEWIRLKTPTPLAVQPLPPLSPDPIPLPNAALVPLTPLGEEDQAQPTAVLDRRAGFTASLRPGGHVGPYAVEALLTQAPGATFHLARTLEGERILLQTIRLRAVESKAARVERLYIERRLAALTRGEGEWVLAHGGAEEADGHRLLFWALPLPAGALELKRERRLDLEGVLRTARALAERLRTRHAEGKTDPLLAEATVYGSTPETSTVLGLPIAAPPNWMAAGGAPRRLATEETISSTPVPSGDLYRLGQTLAMVAAPLAEPYPELEALIAQLSDPSPELRGTAEALVTRLDALLEALTAPLLTLSFAGSATVATPGLDPGQTWHAEAQDPAEISLVLAPAAPTAFEVPQATVDPAFTAQAAALALWSVSRPVHAPAPARTRTAVRAEAVYQERTHLARAPLAPPPQRPAEPSAIVTRMIAEKARPPLPRPETPRPALTARPRARMILGMVLALLLGIGLGVLSSQCWGSVSGASKARGGSLATLP